MGDVAAGVLLGAVASVATFVGWLRVVGHRAVSRGRPDREQVDPLIVPSPWLVPNRPATRPYDWAAEPLTLKGGVSR